MFVHGADSMGGENYCGNLLWQSSLTLLFRGSLFEVRTQLELAVRLWYVNVPDEMWLQIDRISKMLYSLMSKLRH